MNEWFLIVVLLLFLAASLWIGLRFPPFDSSPGEEPGWLPSPSGSGVIAIMRRNGRGAVGL